MNNKVFINPGHDLNLDPGAVNQIHNLTEAKIVYKIGQAVSYYLQQAGYETMIMQHDDLDLVCETANNFDAFCFVSIHCNSAENVDAKGTESYSLTMNGNAQYLAGCISRQIKRRFSLVDRGLKIANFKVLRDTAMPACLVETCFISNEEDCKLLMDENSLDQFARAISIGITDFYLLLQKLGGE